jgi:hypothetical protein
MNKKIVFFKLKNILKNFQEDSRNIKNICMLIS